MTDLQRQKINALSPKQLISLLLEIKVAKNGLADLSQYHPTTALDVMSKETWLWNHAVALDRAADAIGFTASELIGGIL